LRASLAETKLTPQQTASTCWRAVTQDATKDALPRFGNGTWSGILPADSAMPVRPPCARLQASFWRATHAGTTTRCAARCRCSNNQYAGLCRKIIARLDSASIGGGPERRGLAAKRIRRSPDFFREARSHAGGWRKNHRRAASIAHRRMIRDPAAGLAAAGDRLATGLGAGREPATIVALARRLERRAGCSSGDTCDGRFQSDRSRIRRKAGAVFVGMWRMFGRCRRARGGPRQWTEISLPGAPNIWRRQKQKISPPRIVGGGGLW